MMVAYSWAGLEWYRGDCEMRMCQAGIAQGRVLLPNV